MAWDREQYQREILVPARKSGRPPADLLVRYGFTGQLPGEAAFQAQIGQVVGEWKKLKSKPIWAKLVEELLARHAELERAGALTPATFLARRDKERAEAARQMDDLIRKLNATHVGPAAVAWLRGEVGGGVDDAQLRQALAAANITVIDQLPELPVTEPSGYAELADALRALGAKLSAEVVFGSPAIRAGGGFRVLDGFRLADGRRLDGQALKTAADRSSALAHANPQKTPTGTVITRLRSAHRDGTLDQLLLWEVIGPLRKQVAVLGQKAIASQAAAVGLDSNEAGVIAAALASEGAVETRRRQIVEDLAAGRLRSAQRQAASLPGDDELRAQVGTAVAEVADFVARADAELSAGRTEEAARLLADATARVTDDEDLPKRLAGLAPPPPRDPTAVLDGDRALITWQASASQVGPLHYRVARGVGQPPRSPAGGVTIATDTGELHAADPAPPVGVDLYYAVFAGRGGPQWSAPAHTSRLVFAPDVTGVALDVTAAAVGAVWRPPRGAAEIRVVRVVDGRETPVATDLTGFNDTGLTAGVEYLYRISAVYRIPDGSARTSAGVVVRAVPAPAPVPVDELHVQASPPVIEVSWAPPPLGRVDLLISRVPPPWPPGTEPGQAELAAFGHPVPGAPRPVAIGRVAVHLPIPPGRHYLLAVTRVGRRAVAGARIELGLAEPASELRAQRLLDDAQLSWIWPDGAVDSIITWPGGERRCSRRKYHDEGGMTIPVGPEEVIVTVRSVHPDPAAELIALPISVTVAARKAKVSYRWLKAGPLQPGRRLLELTSDQPCELPELVVVRSTAAFPPDEPADGIEVTRLPPASITPGIPLKIPVDLPKRVAGFLACFTASSHDSGPLLFPPPPSEMRIR